MAPDMGGSFSSSESLATLGAFFAGLDVNGHAKSYERDGNRDKKPTTLKNKSIPWVYPEGVSLRRAISGLILFWPGSSRFE